MKKPGYTMIVDAAEAASSAVEKIEQVEFSQAELRVLAAMVRDYQETLQRIARSVLDDFSTLHPMACSFEARRCLEKYGMSPVPSTRTRRT